MSRYLRVCTTNDKLTILVEQIGFNSERLGNTAILRSCVLVCDCILEGSLQPCRGEVRWWP